MLASSRILSVILPNYNHGRFLKERVSSILEALPADGELILIDDGSTDESIEIIKNLEGSDQRLGVIYNPVNQGVNQAVNEALTHARGKYVSFLSADDHILPQFFHHTLKVLTSNPTVSLCCSDCGFFFDRYKIRNKDLMLSFRLLNKNEPLICSAEEALVLFRDHRFWVPGLTSLVKRDLVNEYGRFNTKLQLSHE